MEFAGQAAFEKEDPQTPSFDAESGPSRLARVSPLNRRAKAGKATAPTRRSIAQLLHKHDIALTRQRIEIAYTLFTGQQHMSADQVLAAVNARRIKASKATIYNTLNLFRQKNLVRELIIDPSKIFYDRNTQAHHHFYDIETGTLTDIPAENVHIAGLPQLPPGVITEGVDVIVRTRRIKP